MRDFLFTAGAFGFLGLLFLLWILDTAPTQVPGPTKETTPEPTPTGDAK